MANKSTKNILVLDWSNMMFRSLFMHKLFASGPGTYDRIEDLYSFTHKFAVDICSIVNMFHPNKVIIAADSQHAWRKDVDSDYKSNREKDPNVNWDNIYKCSDDLLTILKKEGMDVAQTDHAEADDIMAMIKETVFAQYPDYNVIIVSADADIRQLIDFNSETNQFCVVYNTTGRGKKSSTRRMYVTQEFKDWVDKEDSGDIFFSDFDVAKAYVKDLLKLNSIIEVYVDNPNEVVLNKILCGDDGDSVMSFYGYYKNGRYVRVTPTKAAKILELTNSDNVKSLCESVNRLPAVFEKVFKKTIDDIDFNERLNKQRTMVELNSELFPEKIREYKETIDYMIRNNVHTGVFMNLKATELMKGTVYEGADKKKALVADVFKDFEKMGRLKNPDKKPDNPPRKVKTVEQDVIFQIDSLF